MNKLSLFLEGVQGNFENIRMRKLGLPDFETVADTRGRDEEMAARLRNHNFKDEAFNAVKCGPDQCGFNPCRDGCNRGSRRRRIEMLESAVPIFQNHSGPVFSVTIVHPKWELESGQLSSIKLLTIRQWWARRLNDIPSNIIALGNIEVTWNIEPDDWAHWAGEIQAVVAGATAAQLRKAFAGIPKRSPNAKPVMISRINDLPRKLAYAQKHLVERRTAFQSQVNGRQARGHMPPPWARWAEHDAWLLGLPLGARTLTFGLARVGQRVFLRS